jgi:hypothetical protein
MFCSNCGQSVDEGTAFCKACGTPAAASGPAAGGPVQMPPGAQAPPAAQAPQYVTPTANGYPPGYAPGWQPPQPPPPRGGRGGLIAGIVVAVVIVLAGAGLGAYFGFIRDDSGGKDEVAVSTISTATSAGSSTTGRTSTTTAAGGSTSTLTSNSTFQTVPSLNTTTSRSTTTSTVTSIDAATAYLTLTDEIVAELEADDARIPQLATTINVTAPSVPQAVYDELQQMMGRVSAFGDKLWAVGAPEGFGESFSWLDEAVQYMASRIGATIAGVEVMWSSGKISSADDFFNQGRTDRDAYRKAMAMYYETLPIE